MTLLDTFDISERADSGPPAPAPLTPEQLAAIELAHVRSRKLRRAGTVATVDAALMAVFTGFCFLSALFDPVSGIALGVLFAVVTWNSFRGAAGLKRMDLGAPRLLAWNQLLLAVAIIVYAAYALYSALRGSPALERQYQQIAELNPDIGRMLRNTTRVIYQAVYLGLIGGTVVAQGLTGWYYATRARPMRAYLHETPRWVLDLQRAQAR
jgi:hypothetical protein